MLALSIIYGIPLLFFILFIKNIIKISKIKRNKERVNKALIIKSQIFLLILITIIIFYIWVNYMLSKSIAMM